MRVQSRLSLSRRLAGDWLSRRGIEERHGLLTASCYAMGRALGAWLATLRDIPIPWGRPDLMEVVRTVAQSR